MGNLVAYLFAKRYFYEEGDAKKGSRVFQQKNCALCHEQRRKQTGAPELTLSTERFSPITMSAAMWQHGRAMLEATQREKVAWPELKPSEMLDLIAYLNSRLVTRMALHKKIAQRTFIIDDLFQTHLGLRSRPEDGERLGGGHR